MPKQDTQVSVVLRQNVRKDSYAEFEAVIRVSLRFPIRQESAVIYLSIGETKHTWG